MINSLKPFMLKVTVTLTFDLMTYISAGLSTRYVQLPYTVRRLLVVAFTSYQSDNQTKLEIFLLKVIVTLTFQLMTSTFFGSCTGHDQPTCQI